MTRQPLIHHVCTSKRNRCDLRPRPWTGAAIFVATCIACTPEKPPQPPVPTLPDLVEARSPGVVRIEVPEGYGSGFVVDRAGLIATGYHVIAGQAPIEVVFTEERRVSVVRVVAWDELHDLALVQIAEPVATAVPLGDSQSVRAGESVFTISSPFGTLDHTVTDGLVSSVRGLDDLQLFQISAPISTGSSGGPLFNTRGEVIGITTLIVSGGQNVNFAVPAIYLKNLLIQKNRGVAPARFAELTGEPEASGTVATAGISLPPGLWDNCSSASQEVVRTALADAEQVATPLCEGDQLSACIRIYHGASLGLWAETGLLDCDNLRAFLKQVSADSQELEPTETAAWMQEVFRRLLGALAQASEVTQEAEHVEPIEVGRRPGEPDNPSSE